MKFIKEYHKATKTATIRTNCYAKSVGHIAILFREAEKVNLALLMGDVNIAHYAGRHYKGTYGIEFKVSEKPEGYREISEPQYLLG